MPATSKKITAARKRLVERLEALGIELPVSFRNGHEPAHEEEITEALSVIEEARQAIGTTTHEIDSYERILEKRLRAITSEDGRPAIETHAVLPAPPNLLGTFSDPVGDINLLLDPAPLTTPHISNLIKRIARELIAKVGGREPDAFGVFDFTFPNGAVEPRIVVRWKVAGFLDHSALHGIHEIGRRSYPGEIRGYRGPNKGWEAVIAYRDAKSSAADKRYGVYFGPDSHCDHNGARGVLVTRRFGKKSEFLYLKETFPDTWLSRSISREHPAAGFEIEVREGGKPDQSVGLAQSNFLMLVVALAYFVARGAFIEKRVLAIEVFRALNRVGAEGAARAELYGLAGVLATVERVILLPLQQPELARHYRFSPESVLLAGVPGVGKTLLAKFLMSQSYNAIFASVESTKLLSDLLNEKGSHILLQIDRIGSATQLPVILLLDDIDTRIDPRLLEPGRLSKIVHVPIPDRDERVGILALHLRGMPFQDERDKAVIVQALAGETDGWTGRYLKALAFEAGRVRGLHLVNGNLLQPVGEPTEPMQLADFQRARELILAGVDIGKFRKEDERIQRFISRRTHGMGFGQA
ncbi:MAG: AAA family ATPase [Parcubacteria group bacterium]|nr:AAA family ATPase [Parcubacteria group bacterium]